MKSNQDVKVLLSCFFHGTIFSYVTGSGKPTSREITNRYPNVLLMVAVLPVGLMGDECAD